MALPFPKLKQGVPVLEGRFKLFVSPDGLEAYLRPEENEVLKAQDFEKLKDLLAQYGIVYGLLDPPQFEPPLWIVARGRPPERGEDAKLRFLVDLKRGPKKKGAYLDFREVNALICLREGDPIAQKIPPRPGEPGRDVFGRPLPPPPVKDIPLKLGKNVFFEEETGFIKASRAGVLDLSQGKIEIRPEHLLAHDVDWEVGHIRFFGEKLTIQGSVKRGFKVYAEGDLEITGNVEDETEIEVKGNLLIGGLVHGPARIKASKEMRLAEVEYAQIESGASLVISEYALQVEAKVGGDLIVTEGIGAVVGGEYQVRGNVVARILGSKANIKTVLRTGYDPGLMERFEELSERLLLVEQEKKPLRRLLERALSLYQSGKLSSSQIKAFEKIKKRFEELLREEEKLLQEKKEILSRFKELEKAKVMVMSRVFPNVTIGIGRFEHLVVRPQGSGIFELRKKQILFIPSSKK